MIPLSSLPYLNKSNKHQREEEEEERRRKQQSPLGNQ
jgi:hypothetical protein